MNKKKLIEYEIWRKTLPMTLRNSLDPSSIVNEYLSTHLSTQPDTDENPLGTNPLPPQTGQVCGVSLTVFGLSYSILSFL